MNAIIQEAQNVFANDITAIKPNNKLIVNTLERLEGERKQWEQGAYKTSNQQLYAILAQCFAYGGEMTTSAAKKRSAKLEEFIRGRGYNYKGDSPLMTRIVKAVFGEIDRRRLSTYSLVLREAQKQKVFANDLGNWIEAHGGIQEIRLSQSSTYIKPEVKAKIASEQLDGTTELARLKTEELGKLVNPDTNGNKCVLLAEQQADGSFSVRAVLTGNTEVNAALTAWYGKQREDKRKAKAADKAANDADAKAKAA